MSHVSVGLISTQILPSRNYKLAWTEYIPYKNPYTNNRAEQALLTVWKPGRDREQAETGNLFDSNVQNKNTDTDIAIF